MGDLQHKPIQDHSVVKKEGNLGEQGKPTINQTPFAYPEKNNNPELLIGGRKGASECEGVFTRHLRASP